jgi:hypothetical protein
MGLRRLRPAGGGAPTPYRRGDLVYRYVASDDEDKIGMTAEALLALAKSEGKGPAPLLHLGGKLHTRVTQDKRAVVKRGSGSPAVAMPLISCACIILLGKSASVVFHAFTGDIDKNQVRALLKEIGEQDGTSVIAIYAVPEEWDDRFQEQADHLVEADIPTERIVCVEKARIHFGVNAKGEVGHL